MLSVIYDVRFGGKYRGNIVGLQKYEALLEDRLNRLL
jgi:hypothetical protein